MYALAPRRSSRLRSLLDDPLDVEPAGGRVPSNFNADLVPRLRRSRRIQAANRNDDSFNESEASLNASGADGSIYEPDSDELSEFICFRI